MKRINHKLFLLTAIISGSLFFVFACSDDDSDPLDENGKIPGYREATGSSANELLSDEDFAHLIVELHFVEGYVPTQDARDAYETFLNERLNKETIEIREYEISKDNDFVTDEYSTGDIRNLEDNVRQSFNREDTMTAFMVFLNGNSDRDDGNARVLGLAYNNTSMAVFQETVEDVSSGVGSPERRRVEKTVINHEMGHILGLVNIGTPMVEHHQDEDHGAHCEVEDCLMYYQMKTDALADILTALGEDPSLDEYCIQDLQANGGK